MRQPTNMPESALLSMAATARMDQLAIAGGVSVTQLMARAGAGVAAEAAAWRPAGAIAVACGPGNNGGDGYVAATELKQAGRDVHLYASADPTTAACREAAGQWMDAGGEVTRLDDAAARRVAASDVLLVDALFGAGLSRPLEGPAATLATASREHGQTVISVDVPSGLNGDTGRVPHGVAFQAELTVTFERARPGHYLGVGGLLSGTVRVIPIGVPDDVLTKICSDASVFQNRPSNWTHAVAKTNPLQHKYDYGHAIVCGGPPGHGGAARLAATAALRAGAGLVTLAVTPAAVAENAAQLNAVMLRELPNDAAFVELLQDYRITAVLLGPGAGANRRLRTLVTSILSSDSYRNGDLAVVLDADALSVFEARPEELFAKLGSGRAILTPHAGEFGRLFPDLSKTMEAGERPGPEIICEAAARSHATVLHKGACSIIADPTGHCCLNTVTGADAAPWLATAGTGDALAGLVTGFVTRDYPPFEAAAAAAWIHAEAGRQLGVGLTADDMASALPRAMQAAVDQQHAGQDALRS